MMNDDENSSHSSRSGRASSTGEFSTSSHSHLTDGGDSSSGCYSMKSHGQKEELAARETKHVDQSRAVFLLILFSIATAAAALTYVFISKEQTQDFENEFEDYASEIESVSQSNAFQQYNVLKSLALSVTTLAQAQTTTTNNTDTTTTYWSSSFTIPNFAVQAQQFLESTGAELLMYSPVLLEPQVSEWEHYSVRHQEWYQEGLSYENREDEWLSCCIPKNSTTTTTIIPKTLHPDEQVQEEDDIPHFLPLWQTFPTPKTPTIVNFNLVFDKTFNRLLHFLVETGEPALSEVIDPVKIFGEESVSFYRFVGDNDQHDHYHPHSLLIQPVMESFEEGSPVVGAVLSTILPWDLYFTDLLHEGANGLVCVIYNSCQDIFTYQINGPKPTFLGYGDHHDNQFDDYRTPIHFEPFPWHTEEDDDSDVNCHYTIDVYPDQTFYDEYHTNKPLYLTMAVCVVFCFTSLSFVVYDRLVQIRQAKIMDTAQRTNAIVASLFPAEFRDRLFRKKGTKRNNSKKEATKMLAKITAEGPKFRLKNFLHEENNNNNNNNNVPGSSSASATTPATEHDYLEKQQPIADLFPNTTVMFADIAGFTAWSSTREPAQVFTLLETVYRAFDHIAKRRRVFKVETIGDCYVAVAGLPEPRKDHAIVMARFARECLSKTAEVTKKLEVTLGPDTGELEMRFGLHSGPVTAGVLRGEKSRFQLFGDTVNTAARMESTGKRGKIHVSQETADLLVGGGKGKWVETREEKVVVKGKGELQTFWVHAKDDNDNHSVCSEGAFLDGTFSKQDCSIPLLPNNDQEAARNRRLVGWMTEVLTGLLQQVVAARPPGTHKGSSQEDHAIIRALEHQIGKGHHVIEEMPEYVPLPEHHDVDETKIHLSTDVTLDRQVTDQLRQYVAVIASMYKRNPFHCFEHATHVTMSVRKLLSRIVSPENPCHGAQFDSRLSVDDKTYGITADKMAQFAVVFCALIHDVDHRGIPNFCLVKEDEELSARYNGKAIAEQNSLDLAWSILMSSDFDELRACIYTTKEELLRFRQLLVNTVIATDIFDPDLAKRRLERWQKAFEDTDQPKTLEHVSRKATIVMEHLIQASDVAHTMQHWQVYVKWNERLFEEMYTAFKQGRFPKDPSANWYLGEIGFFDNYVIPLAKKLDDCGVFGVSSDEYLNYALQNRAEWSNRGTKVVEELKNKVEKKLVEQVADLPLE